MRNATRSRITGWGRHPVVEGTEILSEDLEDATRDARLARGLGRSYGDSSLPARPADRVAGTRLADRLLAFDPEAGRLRAEAGLSLAKLHAIFLARGWASPVAPGTEHVTLGGMVAADVHGKNHHRAGCFGEHVRALRMRVADGRVLEVTEEDEPELFRATLGGMGLTGHVLEVELDLERIPSPWLLQASERWDSLDELLGGLRAASEAWPFSVAWADVLAPGARLGRGIVIGARWAGSSEAPRALPRRRFTPTLPFDLPGFVWSRPAMRAFDALWYRRHPRSRRERIVAPGPFFHPLDAVRAWNRAYGRRGMTQYQAVLPREAADTGMRRLFEILAGSGEGTFLCVVKDFGREGRGLLSFPRPGLTLSVDVPVRGERTQALVDRLNEVVLEAGGRVYLAKDAFTRPEHFRAMERRLGAFLEVKRKWDPEGRIASAQSVRLFGDRA